jgi:hypothetical protein
MRLPTQWTAGYASHIRDHVDDILHPVNKSKLGDGLEPGESGTASAVLGVVAAWKQRRGARDYQEDRLDVRVTAEIAAAAVIDGHGGESVAEYLRQHTLNVLVAEVQAVLDAARRRHERLVARRSEREMFRRAAREGALASLSSSSSSTLAAPAPPSPAGAASSSSAAGTGLTPLLQGSSSSSAAGSAPPGLQLSAPASGAGAASKRPSAQTAIAAAVAAAAAARGMDYAGSTFDSAIAEDAEDEDEDEEEEEEEEEDGDGAAELRAAVAAAKEKRRKKE